MGGTGSGPWPPGYIRKPRVEECRVLDIARLLRGLDQRDNQEVDGSISWIWQNRRTEEVTFFVNISHSTTYDDRPALRLEFIDPIDDNLIRQPVPLEQIEVLGGRAKRWFGRCPECMERCSKLYLPPGNDRFGCRRCLDLSYESTQTSHASVRALRNDPERCIAILNSPILTLGGSIRHNHAMRAAPWSKDKGAGPVPWDKWRLYYLLEGLASGELQRLKVEREEEAA